ncbi:hypothetical protein RCL1_003830 [Eukaryota sp. TZLM3-RCL]
MSILFNASKDECVLNYKRLIRKLKHNFAVDTNKEPLTDSILSHCSCLVLTAPKQNFTLDEFDYLRDFLHSGRSIIILLAEGGEQALGTNINYLLEEFGTSVNQDFVARSVYHSKANPKECVLTDSVGLPVLADLLHKHSNHESILPSFVFPYGATLSVQSPAVPLFLSGTLSFPINRPLGSITLVKPNTSVPSPSTFGSLIDGTQYGKLIVLGSSQIFNDNFLSDEHNSNFADVIFNLAVNQNDQDTIKLIDCVADASTSSSFRVFTDLNDYRTVPEIGAYATKPKALLQTSALVSVVEPHSLIDSTLYSLDTRNLPMSCRLHKDLSLKHQPLTLIQPQFDAPLPSLTPSVFIPSALEPSPPPLELFDLDEEWASEQSGLAKLLSKCSGVKDVDYFVEEASRILGISAKLGPHEQTPKHFVHYLMKQLVSFKKLHSFGDDSPEVKSKRGIEKREAGVDMLYVV